MTPIYGLTEGGLKKTGRDARVLPKTVIYDVNLTLSLPPALSATSGMNAIAHAVEALYAQDANPVMSMLAQEGIRRCDIIGAARLGDLPDSPGGDRVDRRLDQPAGQLTGRDIG